MRRSIVSVVLVLLILLTACDARQPSGQSTAMISSTVPVNTGTTLTILTWNRPLDGALDELSDVLEGKGLNISFRVLNIQANAPSQIVDSYKEQLKTADITMFYDYSTMCAVYDTGMLEDFFGYAEKDPLLFESVSDASWNSSLYNGTQIGYPLLERTSGILQANSVFIRTDVVDELGMELPKTPEELLELCKAAREHDLPCELVTSAAPPYAFQRTYDNWPFFVDGDSLALFEGDTVSPYVESDVFKRDMESISAFGQEGLLRLLLQNDKINEFQSKWDALACLYPVSVAADSEYAGIVKLVQFAPEKEYIAVNPSVFRWVGVSSASENKEKVFDFLTLLYTDSEVYDALVYGVEGKHWEKNADGVYKVLTDNPFGTFFSSALEMNRSKRAASSDELSAEQISAFYAGSLSYQTDAQAVSRIFSSSGFGNENTGMLYIRAGLIPEDGLDSAIRSLKDAGLDNVVKSFADQYTAYLAGK